MLRAEGEAERSLVFIIGVNRIDVAVLFGICTVSSSIKFYLQKAAGTTDCCYLESIGLLSF